MGGHIPTYDADGDLTNDTNQSYTWDADGHMHAVGTTTVTYDGAGRVVEIFSGSGYTQIVYDTLGNKLALMSGQSLTKAFVGLSGGDTAVYSSSGLLYYRHGDWLGSSRLDSTPSRTVYSETAYGPYGETYAGSGTNDPSFTGQNQDILSTGSYPLYDFIAREYHPMWGRWVSPDPAGLAAVNPANPQTWNRYAYVGNNPLALTDPLGLYIVPPTGCDGEPWWMCLPGGEGGGPGGGDVAGGGGGGAAGPVTPRNPKLTKNCLKALSKAGQNKSALSRLSKYWGTIETAAADNGVDPAILGAVAIRESGANPNAVQPGGQGRGMFQIDLGQNPKATPIVFNVAASANFAANMLGSDYRNFVFQGYSPGMAEAGAIRSYNAGPGGLTPVLMNTGYVPYLDVGTVDPQNTASQNYVTNVLAIAANCF